MKSIFSSTSTSDDQFEIGQLVTDGDFKFKVSGMTDTLLYGHNLNTGVYETLKKEDVKLI